MAGFGQNLDGKVLVPRPAKSALQNGHTLLCRDRLIQFSVQCQDRYGDSLQNREWIVGQRIAQSFSSRLVWRNLERGKPSGPYIREPLFILCLIYLGFEILPSGVG